MVAVTSGTDDEMIEVGDVGGATSQARERCVTARRLEQFSGRRRVVTMLGRKLLHDRHRLPRPGLRRPRLAPSQQKIAEILVSDRQQDAFKFDGGIVIHQRVYDGQPRPATLLCLDRAPRGADPKDEMKHRHAKPRPLPLRGPMAQAPRLLPPAALGNVLVSACNLN
jgi:hypothetical protein